MLLRSHVDDNKGIVEEIYYDITKALLHCSGVWLVDISTYGMSFRDFSTILSTSWDVIVDFSTTSSSPWQFMANANKLSRWTKLLVVLQIRKDPMWTAWGRRCARKPKAEVATPKSCCLHWSLTLFSAHSLDCWKLSRRWNESKYLRYWQDDSWKRWNMSFAKKILTKKNLAGWPKLVSSKFGRPFKMLRAK